LKYLERLAPDSAGDPALQEELGRAYIKIGAVQGRPSAANLGDREGAIASFRKAQELLAPLATRPDASVDVFGHYLDAIRFLSETQRATDRPTGLATARLAVDEARRFSERHPESDEVQGFHALAEFHLALAIGPPESLPHWQKAGDIYDALLARKPDDPRRQRNAALVQKYLGGFFETQADYAAALPHHLKALALDQQRYGAVPTDRVAKLDVAIDLSNVAYAHWKRNALTDAVDVYRRSLAMRQELLSSDPKDDFAIRKVAYVHYQLGRVLRLHGDAKEATEHLQLGIAMYERAGLKDEPERNEAAEAWLDLAKIRAADGAPGPACEAFIRAFHLYRAVSPRARVDSGEEDPLLDVARKSVACGFAGAAEWLEERTRLSALTGRR
jgi:tetratricopeptide (TPR) repeat protein